MGTTRVIRLARPVELRIVYWTAWVDDRGAIQFRPDVYGLDGTFGPLLEPPPREGGAR